MENGSKLGACGFALGLCLLPAVHAAAEDTWVVFEVRVPGTGSIVSAERVAEALREQGHDVLSGTAAAAKYERAHSRSAIRVEAAEIHAFEELQHALADALAADDYRKARPLLQ